MRFNVDAGCRLSPKGTQSWLKNLTSNMGSEPVVLFSTRSPPVRFVAAFVDAAGVDPQPLVAILPSFLAALDDLSIAAALLDCFSLFFLHLHDPDHLFLSPAM